MIYCERTGSEFWAEPLNALTNGAFLLAAWWLIPRLRGCRWHSDWDRMLLTVLIALIGIGSFLWHTLATRWAALADIVPIAAFIHLYLIAFVRRLYRPSWWVISAVLSVYLGVETALAWLLPRGALNGSVGYLAPLLTLPLLAWLAQRRGVDGAQALWVAGGLFLVTVSLRTVDHIGCAAVPFGTHFLWHLGNAVLLALLTQALAGLSTSTALRRPHLR